MIVDSSALLAVLFRESNWQAIAEKLRDAKISKIAAPTFLETTMAVTRLLGDQGTSEVRQMVDLCRISIVPFGARETDFAISAFMRYGKGRGHPAQLNFGDCISYATSKVEGMPLLFKGDDFRSTDVTVAL